VASTETISWAEGSFPFVGGVTSESDNGVANNYSLQMNTNQFSTPICRTSRNSNCIGWEQFLYATNHGGFIQHWVYNYGAANVCPSAAWKYGGGGCYRNSNTVPIPVQPITNLADVSMTGIAGSADRLTISVGDVIYTVSQQPSLLGLAAGWNAVEFNVFGNANKTQAVFNGATAADPFGGSTIVVQTLIDSIPPTTIAPTCIASGTTGESNNLNLVGSCVPFAFAGSVPGVQFEESNSIAASQNQLVLPLEPVDPNWSMVAHPFDGIVAGRDADGTPLVPCRVSAGPSGLQVGKTRADWNYCDYSYGGGEQQAVPYETLVAGWTDDIGGNVPNNAFAFGSDGSGGPALYPCRAYLNGNGYQLGKARPGLTGCNIPYGGSEQTATYYQALTTALPLTTQSVDGAPPPAGALVGGYDSDGAPLYVCQAMFNGGFIPGKTRSSWTTCDVSWGGQEHQVLSYNVLVPKLTSLSLAPFQAGTDANGSALGICSASYQNSQQVGKYLSGGNCNFGFGGGEVSLSSGYQVLAF
jgi:hypothetical protein